ncbi:hypothetical protein CONPUDRAFT_58275, partial [Coniophora puteana RWD-64-598 SS2]
ACFEELCQDLLCSTLEPVEEVLCNLKIEKVNIHEIALADTHFSTPFFQLCSILYQPSLYRCVG